MTSVSCANSGVFTGTPRPLDLALQRGLPAVSVNGIMKVTLGRPVR